MFLVPFELETVVWLSLCLSQSFWFDTSPSNSFGIDSDAVTLARCISSDSCGHCWNTGKYESDLVIATPDYDGKCMLLAIHSISMWLSMAVTSICFLLLMSVATLYLSPGTSFCDCSSTFEFTASISLHKWTKSIAP